MTIHSHATNTAGGVATYTTTTTTITTTEDTRTALINNQYFVDPVNGNDSYTGHQGSPWKTIAKVNAAALVPGDQVFFKRGETFTGALVPGNNGDVNRYILFGAYGEGARPIIDGTASVALYIEIGTGRCYLRYENIDFAGSTAGAGTNPTVRACGHDLYFYDCIFRDAGAGSYCYGFYAFTNGAGTELYNITLDSCQAYNNQASGILIGSGLGSGGPHDCEIKYCVSHNNGKSGGYANHGIYVRHGVTVHDCISYSNEDGGIKVNCEMVYDSPYHSIAHNNICYDNHDGLVIENIYSKIYNNLCYANRDTALNLGASPSYSEIYFNTFINTVSPSNGLIKVHPNTTSGLVVKNNLFIQDAAVYDKYIFYTSVSYGTIADLAGNGNVFDYNLYYHNGSTAHDIFYDTSGHPWTYWMGLGQEVHGVCLAAVPGFLARYTDMHPANAGNLKALGLCILGYQQDKDGHYKSEPPTPGCYEEASA